MILTVVGSGTLVPSARRSTPALALRAGEAQITVDGGSGTLRRQAELGIDFRRTTLLLFSHIHPDHTLDLLHFLFAAKYTPGYTRADPVEIAGPEGFAGFVERLRDGYRGWTDGGAAGLAVRELRDRERFRAGPVEIEAVALRHPVRNLGYRFRTGEGGTAAFTGDTGDCPELVELARDADLLVAECSGDAAHPAEGHLTAPEAGRAAARGGAGQLVLTHLYPLPDDRARVAEAAREFTGPVVLGEDGMRFEV